MANIIRIKRRATGAVGAPSSLQNAELAFNEVDNVLYYGKGTGGVGGTATTVDAIGGSGAFLTLTSDQTVSGIKTFSNTIVGNIDTADKLRTARTVDVTGDATWQVTFDGSSNVTSALTLANTTVTAGTYGSATAIPTFTVDSKGRLTAAGTVSVATVLNIAGDTGTDGISLLSDTFTVTGGDGVTTTVGTNAVTIDADATIARRADTHYIGTTAVALNRASANLALTGITSVTSSAALTLNAGGTNTNINLVPNGTGTVDVGSKRITSVADPTQATDAATKQYVDAVKTGLTVKDSARVATTTALTVTYSNGASGVGATLTNANTQTALTIDSVALVIGDRVLVKDQASALQNGIYVVTDVGSASTNWVLTRATDFDQSPAGEIVGGDFVFVQEGTINADNGYVVTTNGAITVGTTLINWAQFSGAGQVVAGDGLTKSGNTLNAVGTANRITVSADAIDISANYVGQSTITTLGTIGTGTWQGTIISPTYGGTGVNNGTKTITLGGNFTTSGAFTTTLTATANTSITLPTSGTLATLAGTESLSNKTITSSSFSGTTISASGDVTFTSTTDATALGTAPVILSGGLSVAKSVYFGANLSGAGASTSTLDGFNIDGGTY